MQDITALEQRIAAALDRIGRHVDQLGAKPAPAPAPAPVVAAAPAAPLAAADSDAVAALQALLEEERSLTSRLQKQLRVSKEREAKGDMQDKLDRVTRQLDAKGLEVQRMRRATILLTQQLEMLRATQIEGVVNAQQINRSMMTELDALRALRLTEMAEMDEILAALEPHLTEAENAGT